MEDNNGQSIQSDAASSDSDLHKGTWVLVTIGPSRIFGRVHALDHEKVGEKEVPVEDVLKAVDIAFKPVFDYFSPIRPMPIIVDGKPVMKDGQPQMGYGREHICTTRDSNYDTNIVHLVKGPGMQFDFLSQMSPRDRKRNQELLDMACAASARSAAAKEEGSGKIVAPSNAEVAKVSRQHGRS